MSGLYTDLHPQFLVNGSPASNGSVEFFNVGTTGTSNRRDTFSDPELTILNSNPVNLDENGRSVSPIFLSGTYNTVIRDANGVQIDVVDNVASSTINIEGFTQKVAAETNLNFATVALMEAATDLVVGNTLTVDDYATGNNSGVLYFPVVPVSTGTADGGSFIDLPGSGFQAEQNFPSVISAKMFGATGDGVTDDTTAIQSALDYIDSLGGGSLFFPAGTYIISTLLLPGSFTEMHGTGYSSLIKADGVSVFSGSFAGDPTATGMITIFKKFGVTVRGFRFDGNKAVKDDGEVTGIQTMEATDCIIDHVWIANMPTEGIGLTTISGDGIIIADADLTDNPSERILISNFHIENVNRQGIAVTFGQEINIINGTIKGSFKEGIDLEPNATDFMKNINVAEVHLSNNNFGINVSTSAISPAQSVTNAENITITACTFNDHRSGSIVCAPSSGSTFFPTNIAISNCVMTNNSTDNPSQAGSEGDIDIQAIGATVSNCISVGSGASGLTINDTANVVVNGCTVRNARFHGIWVDADRGSSNTSDVKLIGNQLINNGQATGVFAGIALEDGGGGNTIDRILVSGNIMIDTGGGTQDFGLQHVNNNSDQSTWVIQDNLFTGNAVADTDGTINEIDQTSWVVQTISSDSVQVPFSTPGQVIKLKLEPETGTTDDLATLTIPTSGIVDGQQIVLRTNTTGDTITIKNGTGNIRCNADQILNSTRDVITLIFSSDDVEWLMQSFSSNA